MPYRVDGHDGRLVYLSQAGDLAAYEELRSGFTAAVSHELRTPLARLLSLLELAALPGEDVPSSSSSRAREIDQIVELIDEVLFLAELESGTRVVSLGAEPVLPVLHEVAAELEEQAARAGVALHVGGRRERDRGSAAAHAPRRRQESRRERDPLRRPRHDRDLSVRRSTGEVVLRVVDDGAGVDQADLARLFERFYRADRSRASRGTGLGLAIVKHVVASAGGTVEAQGGRGRGLEIRCSFPTRHVARFTTLSPDLHHPAPPSPRARWKTRRMTSNTRTIVRHCAAAGPARPSLAAAVAAAATTGPATRPLRRRRQRPLRPHRGGRLQHRRPLHDRGGRALPARERRRPGDGRRLRAPAAASSASAAARPTSRTPRARSRTRRRALCEDEGIDVRRVPGRERRAHGRRQQGQRLGRRA